MGGVCGSKPEKPKDDFTAANLGDQKTPSAKEKTKSKTGKANGGQKVTVKPAGAGSGTPTQAMKTNLHNLHTKIEEANNIWNKNQGNQKLENAIRKADRQLKCFESDDAAAVGLVSKIPELIKNIEDAIRNLPGQAPRPASKPNMVAPSPAAPVVMGAGRQRAASDSVRTTSSSDNEQNKPNSPSRTFTASSSDLNKGPARVHPNPRSLSNQSNEESQMKRRYSTSRSLMRLDSFSKKIDSRKNKLSDYTPVDKESLSLQTVINNEVAIILGDEANESIGLMEKVDMLTKSSKAKSLKPSKLEELNNLLGTFIKAKMEFTQAVKKIGEEFDDLNISSDNLKSVHKTLPINLIEDYKLDIARLSRKVQANYNAIVRLVSNPSHQKTMSVLPEEPKVDEDTDIEQESGPLSKHGPVHFLTGDSDIEEAEGDADVDDDVEPDRQPG